MTKLYKYPRTPHIEGSRLQVGDEDLESVSFSQIKGRFIVVEEKLDGANSGISFDNDGRLLLQSRGHFLDGGARERQFAWLKTWARAKQQTLHELLENRYVMYGEWVYAKHTIFYDALPHYFFEFDLLDVSNGEFLSTERRHLLLKDSPLISVPVLWQGIATSLEHLQSLLTTSLYKSAQWRENLALACNEQKQNLELVRKQTDNADLAEGLYIKVEEDGRVVERYKFVRAEFLQAVVDSGSHWMDRPILPNRLHADVDIFA
ncbi:MAG: RNA ligase family protein [Blastocatellia bacterium]|nr:RNA ligase family protein [Blastocatellia bacterium]